MQSGYLITEIYLHANNASKSSNTISYLLFLDAL